MALSESAGGVSTWPTSSNTVTTGTITPASGDLLVAIATADNDNNGAATSIAMSGTGAMSGTWTLRAHLYLTTGPMAAVFVKDAGASPSSGTATATFTTPSGNNGLIVRRFAGAAAAASQTGVTATGGSAGGGVYALSITPGTTGSRVVGSFGDSSNTITVVANAATTIYVQGGAGGGTNAAFEASSASTSGTPVTVGFTNTGSDSTSIVLVEVLPGGTTHTATASLTVTPSFSAPAAHVTGRTASLTVTPALSAADTAVHRASASLTVTPAFSAPPGSDATASLTVPPVLSGSAAAGASVSLTVTPALSAADTGRHVRAASLTVTPALSGAAAGVRPRAASLTVTPVLSTARSGRYVRHASLTVTPVLAAGASHGTGAPPGYPDGDLGAMVELLLGGDWTDITTAALPAGQQYGSIKGGQPDGAQQPTPTIINATWDNPDYSLSPRNSAGPYYGQLRQNTPARVSFNSPYGPYLRLEADNEDMASVADTSALHVTGSLELRIGMRLSDWRPCTLAARNDGTTASWSLLLNADGTLSFFWFDSGGTLRHVTSPAAAGVSWTAYRVTLTASNGNVQFYLSDTIDGSWTSMGAAASGTSGAATTVRAGNSPLITGWSAAAGKQMRGQVYGLRLYNGLAASGGTVVADAQFSAQLPGITSWTDAAGRTWNLSGGAELTGRDYRLHGEVASLSPTADVSSSLPRVQAQLAGRMRRLQQAAAPVVDSAMKRAILSQPGSLYPVWYAPMEETQAAKTFGPAVGSHVLAAELGTVQAAADSSLEASAPLPLLGGDTLSVTVDTYSGATAWAVRFVFKEGTTLPASGTARLIEVTTTGACTTLRVSINPDGTFNFTGLLSGGSTAFSFTEVAYPQIPGPAWWSVEATTSGSGVLYALLGLAPGGATANTEPSTVTGHGGFGVVTAVNVNQDLILTDSMFGHLSVQKAWTSMNTLGAPLNAWRTELAADRFSRVCAEQGIACRVIGRQSTTQIMGPQPRGSTWTILRDCQQTEQGLIFEPFWACLGVGFRTRESMGAQQAGVTLSFADATLRGDLQPADDDSGFLNDVTGAMSDGTSWREVLDDGSATSVSEPADGGRGRYAGAMPFAVNVDDPSELGGNVAFYLGRVSVDEPRYRNVTLDLGIDGAPAAAIAHLRPGDKAVITDVPGIYQTADIGQLAMGWTEAFGPGRAVTWDCVPASPYE